MIRLFTFKHLDLTSNSFMSIDFNTGIDKIRDRQSFYVYKDNNGWKLDPNVFFVNNLKLILEYK